MQIDSNNPRMRDVIFYYMMKGLAAAFVLGVRVVVYFIDLTLLLLSNLLEKLVLENWDYWYNKYVENDDDKEETKYQIEILESTDSTKHEYKMKRSKEFTKLYNDLLSNITVSNTASVTIDKKLSEDMIAKIDRILYLAEKEALQQGYKFASATNGELEISEIYQAYIISQVFKGE